jgi:hypothetical protein
LSRFQNQFTVRETRTFETASFNTWRSGEAAWRGGSGRLEQKRKKTYNLNIKINGLVPKSDISEQVQIAELIRDESIAAKA